LKEGELQKESVWANFAHTAEDGKTYHVDYYNLDMIIQKNNIQHGFSFTAFIP